MTIPCLDFQNLRCLVQKIRRPHRESLQQDSAGKVPMGHWHGRARLRVMRYLRVILPPPKTFDPLPSVCNSFSGLSKNPCPRQFETKKISQQSVKYWRPCSKISWGFVHRCFEKATILKKIHTFCVSKNNLYIADYREELNSIYNYIFGGVWLPKKKISQINSL